MTFLCGKILFSKISLQISSMSGLIEDFRFSYLLLHLIYCCITCHMTSEKLHPQKMRVKKAKSLWQDCKNIFDRAIPLERSQRPLQAPEPHFESSLFFFLVLHLWRNMYLVALVLLELPVEGDYSRRGETQNFLCCCQLKLLDPSFSMPDSILLRKTLTFFKSQHQKQPHC